MLVPESATDYDIVVAAGAVMDCFGVGILEIDKFVDGEIYELFQLILDEEVKGGNN